MTKFTIVFNGIANGEIEIEAEDEYDAEDKFDKIPSLKLFELCRKNVEWTVDEVVGDED